MNANSETNGDFTLYILHHLADTIELLGKPLGKAILF